MMSHPDSHPKKSSIRRKIKRLISSCCYEPLESRTLLAVNPVGSEFIVNQSTTIFTTSPAVAMDAHGNYVVVWVGYGDAASTTANSLGQDIYAQRYNAAGVAQGTTILVNNNPSGDQIKPAVAMDADGNFVVVWVSPQDSDLSNGIYARKFAANGTPFNGNTSEVHLNEFTTGDQTDPAVAMDDAGDCVVTWTSYLQDGSAGGIYARVLNPSFASITASEFKVNTSTDGTQIQSDVAMDAAGDFVVVFSGYNYLTQGRDIFYRRYSLVHDLIDPTILVSAQPSGFVDVQVNTLTDGDQSIPDVAMDAQGDFVVAFAGTDATLDTDGGVYARVFDFHATPVAQGTEFLVNSVTADIQDRPAVAMNRVGDFVVVFQSNGPDGDDNGVIGQAYSIRGNVPIGSNFIVNTTTTVDQDNAAIAMDPDGDFVVIWQSGIDQSNNKNVEAQQFQLTNAQTSVSVVATVTAASETGPVNGTFVVTRTNADTSLSQTVNFSWAGLATYGVTNSQDFVFRDANNAFLTNVNQVTKTATITIPAGQTQAIIKVIPFDDTFDDDNETITLTIEKGLGYLANNTNAPQTVTIEDNDIQGLIVSPLTISVPEGGSSTFGVKLNARPSANLIVNINVLSGGDADLTSNVTQLIFNATNFNVIQNVTISDAQDADSLNGTATFAVSSDLLATFNVVATEVDDDVPPSAATGAPDLQAGSDTGSSSTDNITKLDNSSVGKALTFDIPGTIAGATVQLFADGTLVGTGVATGTTTTITTSGGLDLTDGSHVFTAKQTEVGKGLSVASSSLSVSVVTTQPVVTISQLKQQADPTSSLPIAFSVIFNQAVSGFNIGNVQVSGTATGAVASLTGSGKNYIITITQISTAGTVTINIPAAVVSDLAGNPSLASINLDNSVTYTGSAAIFTPFATLTNGLLVVNGTTEKDTIFLFRDSASLIVQRNNVVQAFNNADISRIQVFSDDGNDVVAIGRAIVSTYVLGGLGNDCLIGGEGDDSLTGASGKDTLIGNAGNDNLNGGKHGNVIQGGAGDDRIYGGDGLDLLDGGDGNDRMYGNGSADNMTGGNGNDTIYGDDGNDTIDGGSQNDHIFGGNGNDSLLGGRGNDIIADQDGSVDSIIGGDGNDSAFADDIDILRSIENTL
ncbi:MAG TPA: hypothetical protein VHD56_13075 [Tepidisphaeraceae bacterium]|nr:hypothetical protein [Tepidisphaeraceae bacterium]